MTPSTPSLWKSKAFASLLHLGLSLLVAAAVAGIVFGVWYPHEYSAMSGGRNLFVLMASVDVVMGPLLTLVVFNPAKPRTELRRDLAIIGLLQLAALGYGMHTAFVARPVGLVFEVDRFKIVSANDVLLSELPQARPEYRQLPWLGPQLMSARESKPGDEKLRSIELSLQGYDVGQRPSYWQPYADAQARAAQRAQPVSTLIQRNPTRRADIEAALREHHAAATSARFLPIQSRMGDWVMLLNEQGQPLGILAANGFF